MSRAAWKGPFMDKAILKIITRNVNLNLLNVWSRRSTIPASLINKRVLIYNGHIFKTVFITSDKVGFKFGDFVQSRQRAKFSKIKKIKKNK